MANPQNKVPDRTVLPVTDAPETVPVPLDPPPPPDDLSAPAAGRHQDGTTTPGAGGAVVEDAADAGEHVTQDLHVTKLQDRIDDLQAKIDDLMAKAQAGVDEARAKQTKAAQLYQDSHNAPAYVRLSAKYGDTQIEQLAEAVGLAPNDVLDLTEAEDTWVVTSVDARKLQVNKDDL